MHLDKWSKHTDELSWKTVDTVHRLLHEYDENEIDLISLRIALRALWDATAGLTTKDVMDLIASVLNKLDNINKD